MSAVPIVVNCLVAATLKQLFMLDLSCITKERSREQGGGKADKRNQLKEQHKMYVKRERAKGEGG